MRVLYLDIFSGISGDMLLGALIDLGADARTLERELKKLRLDGYKLQISRRQKSGIDGVKFDVRLDAEGEQDHHSHSSASHKHPGNSGRTAIRHSAHHHHHDERRTFAQIKQLISESRLSGWVKKKSLGVFQRIAVAEGKIHGLPAEQVHFHEVGAVDSIIDVVGACIALDLLGRPKVIAAPVVEGVGWVDCAHGRFPVPAPATLAILGARGVGVTQCEEPHELVTPTGAALLAEFAENFGPMRGLTAQKIGFGLGTRENRTRPNVLRAILGGQSEPEKPARRVGRDPIGASPVLDWETDSIAVLESNLDDINAEILGNFVELALNAGALDVFHTPVQMKKNRPGVLLSVLCAQDKADLLTELMLRQTTAFGVRRSVVERRKLQREFKTIKTEFGQIVVKIGTLGGKIVQAAPEYESCKKAAGRARVPLKAVYEAAIRKFQR